MRVRFEDIRLGPNVCAGMSELKVMHFAYLLRTTCGDPLPPVQLLRKGDCWQIHDGRHRVVAGMIAGRCDVLAEEHSPSGGGDA
jgi:hypothetical protein